MLGEVLGSYIHSKGSIPFSPLGYQACWAGLPDKARCVILLCVCSGLPSSLTLTALLTLSVLYPTLP